VVDTRDGCKGAYIYDDNRSLYINTIGTCFDLPQTVFSRDGSYISIQRVEIGFTRDRKTGAILKLQFWLQDFEQNFYRTYLIEPTFPVVPNKLGFMVPVDQCIEVYPQTKKGKKELVGYLSVGTIEFKKK
jgi:hypothetical protein